MRGLGERIGLVRLGENGTRTEPGEITWLVSDHQTSKPILEDGRVTPSDPDLHSYYSVPNAVLRSDGRIGALNTAGTEVWYGTGQVEGDVERAKADLAAARARGRNGGRPFKMTRQSYDGATERGQGFLAYATDHRKLSFQVTSLGTGLASYTDHVIAPMFKHAPENCSFDEKWFPFLGSEYSYWGTHEG